MLQTRSEHSTCHYDGNIYVFGGVDNADDELRSAERYYLTLTYGTHCHQWTGYS